MIIKVIQEEFDVIESQRFNVSVLMNHHQDKDVKSPIDIILLSPDDGSFEPKHYKVDFLLH